MSLSRVTTWNVGDILTANALNGEFNNILNNAMALITPLTLQNLSSAPTAGTAGRLYYNSGLAELEVDDGSFIRDVPTILSTAIVSGYVVVGSTSASGATFSMVSANTIAIQTPPWLPQL